MTKLIWDDWVIDASLDPGDGTHCFCPVDEDGEILTGLMVHSDKCPGSLVGAIHMDGHEAVEKWVAENEAVIERLRGHE